MLLSSISKVNDIIMYYIKYHYHKIIHSKTWSDVSYHTDSQKKDIEFCYNTFITFYSSYSSIIYCLPNDLSLSIITLMLSIKGLCIVYDDPVFLHENVEEKAECLINFYKTYNNYSHFNDKSSKNFMENYNKVGTAIDILSTNEQKIIKNICQKIGKHLAMHMKEKT